MIINTINPSNGALIAKYPLLSSQSLTVNIASAQEAFLQWSVSSLDDRVGLLDNLAGQLKTRKQEIALLMTLEMGKLLKHSEAEVDKCISLCDYYRENIKHQLADKIVNTASEKSYVSYQPLGVIFAIMPWNFPLWQVFRFAVPNVTAGNVGLLKHAPISMGMSLLIQDVFEKGGYPKNVFQSLVIDEKQASEVINHEHVKGVTITGSERAGRSVAEQTGEALKKVVLELGGSDPYLILEDADLEKAANMLVNARSLVTGQVCISPKRIIIVDAVKENFTQLVLEEAKKITFGDPLDESSIMGPMARKDLRVSVHQQVQDTVKAGAKLLLGGEIPEGEGFYYPMTVLDNIPRNCPASDDEIFGPVICLFSAKDEDDAIAIANNHRYGLGGGVFTQDLDRGEKIAKEKLQAGTCVVNSMVTSNPSLPFGGIKCSGFGRELAAEGLHEFLNVKTVNVD
jgi:succinate-semialdehyde dehydrogenase / glutarate-semialdehyde dehydrogenase